MPLYTDGLNREVAVSGNPQRIISLVPSQSELLHYLGVGDRVVGITKFCVHPAEWFRNKPRVGGTKKIDINKVKALAPDLVLAAKEENEAEDVRQLTQFCPVWTSDVKTFADALQMIRTVGKITHTEERAEALSVELRALFTNLPSIPSPGRVAGTADKQPAACARVAYLIWNDPIMVAGGDTFISDMLACAGFENTFAGQQRYPTLTPRELALAPFDVLFLSSEPFPFTSRHVHHFEALLPGVKVVLVDGELFSWYGSRLLQAPAYFRELHGEVMSKV